MNNFEERQKALHKQCQLYSAAIQAWYLFDEQWHRPSRLPLSVAAEAAFAFTPTEGNAVEDKAKRKISDSRRYGSINVADATAMWAVAQRRNVAEKL